MVPPIIRNRVNLCPTFLFVFLLFSESNAFTTKSCVKGRKNAFTCVYSIHHAVAENDTDVSDSSTVVRPQILPAGDTPNNKCNPDKSISILSWNILLPNSQDNWWCHKMYSPWVPRSARTWIHRQNLIRDRLLSSSADIICIQEADGDSFAEDFDFMSEAGYGHILHRKFRFRCATFYKEDKFTVENVAHKDRVLVTALKSSGKYKDDGNSIDNLLHVINCHLTGGAAPERRLRQVDEALDQLRKWKNAAAKTLSKQLKTKRPSPKNILNAEKNLQCHEEAGVVVCGDFNSDGNTGVRKLLVDGAIDPSWREPQYPAVLLTSKRREQPYSFVDAAELAYASNVCDGDYGEDHGVHGCRPATYIVPHLASLLLSPVNADGVDCHYRTEFGRQVAKGLASTLSLQAFCDNEIEQAFASVDLNNNGVVDGDEVQKLLETVYTTLYGQKIEAEKRLFFDGFKEATSGLTRQQFSRKLQTLQQQIEVEDRDELELTRGLMDSLGMESYCESELDLAFKEVDLDGNNFIEKEEIESLLLQVYLATYGERIKTEKEKFFGNFYDNDAMIRNGGLKMDQFKDRLLALRQELEGGSQGSELVDIKTEADTERMISRFSCLLRDALDQIFDYYCTSDDGLSLSEEDVNKFLIRTNGQLGRGGTWRHTKVIFEKKREEGASISVTMNRQDWYGIFARELGEGKWWQVVHDLEVCGACLRPSKIHRDTIHYQGWLDYIYFDSRRLYCTFIKEAITTAEISRIYDDGDALPNEWHPSDHLPVAATLSWH